MVPPAPLEPIPTFGELSIDELQHRFAKGILTPQELVGDAVANVRQLLPYGGLRPAEVPTVPSLPRPVPANARLLGIPFVSPLIPGSESGLVGCARAGGAIPVGYTVAEPCHHPLDPTQPLTGPWAGGAIALLGWAAPLAMGVDDRGDLARMVLRTGLPGFRMAASEDRMAPGWLFNYLVDAVSIGIGLSGLSEVPDVGTPGWPIEAASEESVRPILNVLGTGTTGTTATGSGIVVAPLTLENADLAFRQNLAAAYIPWRWGGPEALAFQLLASAGSESVLAQAARHLAGPAALF
jgi:hypothetical protein